MKKNLIYTFLIVAITACNSTKKMNKMVAFDYFKDVLCGEFDNKNQVESERKNGQQIHPFAKHVTAIADRKIKNLPVNLAGYFILEESYYTYEGKPTEIKPYLFFIEKVSDSQIKLSSYTLPTDVPKKDIRNNNAAFSLDFKTISVSKTFKPAIYTLADGKFMVNHSTDLGNGMTFTLIETLTKNRLEVMELLERNGKKLTPYDSPIIYERVK
jgi:hypothetical protein